MFYHIQFQMCSEVRVPKYNLLLDHIKLQVQVQSYFFFFIFVSKQQKKVYFGRLISTSSSYFYPCLFLYYEIKIIKATYGEREWIASNGEAKRKDKCQQSV